MDAIAKMPTYEAYKDSGVEWLGEVPEGWCVLKLKYIISSKAGYAFPSEGYENEGIPLIRIGDLLPDGTVCFEKAPKLPMKFKKFLREYSVDNGDMLMAMTGGTIGKVSKNYNSVPALLNQRVCKFKAKDLFNNQLAWHWMNSGYWQRYIEFKAFGGAQPNISDNQIKEMYVVVPNNHYSQILIANFLDQKTAQIDEAIAIKEQQIALLKERKQIIIQKAVTQGLDPDVTMKDSGVDWIGEIPAHWETTRVKNLFRLVMEPSEKNNNHELLSVYTDIGVKPRRELEERGNKASTTDGYWFVKKGDIVVNKLLAWMGAIGFSEYDGVTSPAYDILRPKLPVNGYFYHYLFRSEFCSAELKRHSRGIMDMRLRLYFDKFGDVEVPYPPKEEQDRIIQQMESKMTEIDGGLDHLKLQIAKLKEYKTTLINSAVTGKIRITPEMVA